MVKKERNKSVRLEVLKRRLAAKKTARDVDGMRVLEIIWKLSTADRRAS